MGHAIDRRLVKDWDKIEDVIRPIYEKNLTESEINQPAVKRAFDIEFNALVQDLSDSLRRTWSTLRDIDHSGSEAQIYHTINELISKPEKIISRIWSVDLATRSLIEEHHPDGPLALENQTIDAGNLINACRYALDSLSVPKPSRPKGTQNSAQRFLATELASIYARHVGKPTRVFDKEANIFKGSFRRFVQVVMDLVPIQLRRKSDGSTRLVDHMVQIGVESLKNPKSHRKNPRGTYSS
jgi:hypothetical protein